MILQRLTNLFLLRVCVTQRCKWTVIKKMLRIMSAIIENYGRSKSTSNRQEKGLRKRPLEAFTSSDFYVLKFVFIFIVN